MWKSWCLGVAEDCLVDQWRGPGDFSCFKLGGLLQWTSEAWNRAWKYLEWVVVIAIVIAVTLTYSCRGGCFTTGAFGPKKKMKNFVLCRVVW